MMLKKYSIYLISLFIFLSLPLKGLAQDLERNLGNLFPALPPISVQANQDIVNISPYLRFAHNLEEQNAAGVYAQRDKFRPYDESEVFRPLGTYWFLISFEPVQDKNISASYLDLRNFLPLNSKILILPRGSRAWQVLDDVYTRENFLSSQNSGQESI